MRTVDMTDLSSAWQHAGAGIHDIYQFLTAEVRKSHSGDNIAINFDCRDELLKLWIPDYKRPKDMGFGPPADIIQSRRVPIRDCIFTNANPNATGESWTKEFRVMLFTRPVPLNPYIEAIDNIDYKENMKTSLLADRQMYGVIAFPIRGGNIMDSSLMTLVFGGKEDEQYIRPIMTLCTDSAADKYYDVVTKSSTNIDAFITEAMNGLELWYASQISLLNPVVKTIIAKPRVTAISPIRESAKKGKHIVKYVKTIRLNLDEIRDNVTVTTESEGGKITRRTMCWYVIGHWRRTSKGKVFVNPYWKGPMRWLKGDYGDARDRQLVIKDGDGVTKTL